MSYYTTTSSSPITVFKDGNIRLLIGIGIFVYLFTLFKLRSMKLEGWIDYNFFSKHCIISLIAIILGIIGFGTYIAFSVYCGQYKSLKDEETGTKGPELVKLINGTYIAFTVCIILSIPLAGYSFYYWKTDI